MLAVAIIAASSVPAIAGSSSSSSTARALDTARHWRSVTWQQQYLRARAPYRMAAPPAGCAAACWWHRAVRWHRKAVAAAAATDALRHATPAACYALVRRRFAPAGWSSWATAIVQRESHCTWYAQNPRSTAAGPWQFLDFWGPLELRTDVVWSTLRAWRAWVAQGGACPAWC